MTGNFPNDVVFLETDFAVNASVSADARVIQERVVFARGAFIPKAVRIVEMEALGLRLAGDSSYAQSEFKEKKDEWYSDDYRVQATWKSGGSASSRVLITVWAGWSRRQATSLGTCLMGGVFDCTIKVPDTKLRLIGFRSWDEKTFLWLGVCAVPKADSANSAETLRHE